VDGRDGVDRLGDQVQAGWVLRLYEGAGEAGGCFQAAKKRPSGGGGGPAADPERAALEAGRRARTKLRRYCAANGLNRLGTLTYRGEGCHDPRQVRADVGAFFRRLRAELEVQAFPYAWVPEWHKTDHGLHLHFAVGRYISQPVIERVWGHGFVSIKMLSGCPAGATKVAQARRAAGYLTKYVAKTFADSDEHKRPKGFHRFDVAQGFEPRSVGLRGLTAADVTLQASLLMGGLPARSWNSDEVEGWQGPPALWLQWDGSR
jgi:hypothetical protein